MLGIPGILRITQKWFLICTDYYYQDSDENKFQYLLIFHASHMAYILTLWSRFHLLYTPSALVSYPYFWNTKVHHHVHRAFSLNPILCDVLHRSGVLQQPFKNSLPVAPVSHLPCACNIVLNFIILIITYGINLAAHI